MMFKTKGEGVKGFFKKTADLVAVGSPCHCHCHCHCHCLSECSLVVFFKSVYQSVSESVSDKGTYRAVWGQLKITSV